jgi:hypothetical protein
MTDKASASGWVVEVAGDGVALAYRRYIVNIPDKNEAISAVHKLLGTEIVVSSTSPISGEALEISHVPPGEIYLL